MQALVRFRHVISQKRKEKLCQREGIRPRNIAFPVERTSEASRFTYFHVALTMKNVGDTSDILMENGDVECPGHSERSASTGFTIAAARAGR